VLHDAAAVTWQAGQQRDRVRPDCAVTRATRSTTPSFARWKLNFLRRAPRCWCAARRGILTRSAARSGGPETGCCPATSTPMPRPSSARSLAPTSPYGPDHPRPLVALSRRHTRLVRLPIADVRVHDLGTDQLGAEVVLRRLRVVRIPYLGRMADPRALGLTTKSGDAERECCSRA
jgi:hypothetical protein